MDGDVDIYRSPRGVISEARAGVVDDQRTGSVLWFPTDSVDGGGANY